MPRLAACLALLGCLAFPPNASAQRVVRLLDAASGRLAQNGFRVSSALAAGTVMGRQRDDESRSITVPLRAGVAYLVLGVCDEDCGDLDLALFGAGATVLARDAETSHSPAVPFTPSASGTYRVRVTIETCRANPCRYGVRIFERASDAEGNAEKKAEKKAERKVERKAEGKAEGSAAPSRCAQVPASGDTSAVGASGGAAAPSAAAGCRADCRVTSADSSCTPLPRS